MMKGWQRDILRPRFCNVSRTLSVSISVFYYGFFATFFVFCLHVFTPALFKTGFLVSVISHAWLAPSSQIPVKIVAGVHGQRKQLRNCDKSGKSDIISIDAFQFSKIFRFFEFHSLQVARNFERNCYIQISHDSILSQSSHDWKASVISHSSHEQRCFTLCSYFWWNRTSVQFFN